MGKIVEAGLDTTLLAYNDGTISYNEWRELGMPCIAGGWQDDISNGEFKIAMEDINIFASKEIEPLDTKKILAAYSDMEKAYGIDKICRDFRL